MRLIDTSSLEIKIFERDDIVRYAILSHRREEDEVSLQDLNASDVQTKKGYAKIKHSCVEALSAGLQYLWIDTCCIDKTSSAELSEAINSMYRWYQQAEICYAYLSDVESVDDLASSAWFTRGWTLQELIAPKNVKFYNKAWKSFGSKHGMQTRISIITGIPTRILRGDKLSMCSVAQRFSWAASRVTTRTEDKAYCLMGLFDVNMPMLYGEGTKAFIRLQEEIIKTSDDHSIFAWTMSGTGRRGVLAPSPSCFQHCAAVTSTANSSEPEQYSITNVGLSIRLNLMPWMMNTYLAVLQCRDVSDEKELMPTARKDAQSMRLGILIRQTVRDGQYVRVALSDSDLHKIDLSKYSKYLTPVLISILRQSEEVEDPAHIYGFVFRNMSTTIFGSHRDETPEGRPLAYKVISRLLVIASIWTGRDYLESIDWVVKTVKDNRPVKVIELPHGEQGIVVRFWLSTDKAVHTHTSLEAADQVQAIEFGFDFDFNPVCIIHKREVEKLYNYDETTATLADCQRITNQVNFYRTISPSDNWSLHGIRVLQGHRNRGLKVYLRDLNLRIEIHDGWKNSTTRAWIVDVGVIVLPSVRYSRDREEMFEEMDRLERRFEERTRQGQQTSEEDPYSNSENVHADNREPEDRRYRNIYMGPADKEMEREGYVSG